ncbi:MAG: hypothetical protein M3396_01340 [Actinomycetota bacterium]|nr:hypothetical protein [Actinomycetota bacterium]
MRHYRLVAVSNYRGWDLRGLVEPTQFAVKNDDGHIVYAIAANSAWSDRRLTIRDSEGKEVARLHKKASRNYKLLRHNRAAATVAYKDPVLRWRDRYSIKTRDGDDMEAVQTAVGSGVYQIDRQGRTLARFSHRDLEVDESVDPLMIVAAIVVAALPRSGMGGGD